MDMKEQRRKRDMEWCTLMIDEKNQEKNEKWQKAYKKNN
jgi:hypothetical protein